MSLTALSFKVLILLSDFISCMIDSIRTSAINSIQNALAQANVSAANISSSFTGDYSTYTDDAFVNDIVSLKLSNVQLEASVKLLKESFEMEECLLDIIA